MKKYGILQLQPLKLGSHYFCLVSKFGVCDTFSTGFEKDRSQTQQQLEINQLDPLQKVSRIDFMWKKYENNQHSLFYYTLSFFGGPSGTSLLGRTQNMSDNLLHQATTRDLYIFQEKRESSFHLEPGELLVATKLGLRHSTSVVCL